MPSYFSVFSNVFTVGILLVVFTCILNNLKNKRTKSQKWFLNNSYLLKILDELDINGDLDQIKSSFKYYRQIGVMSPKIFFRDYGNDYSYIVLKEYLMSLDEYKNLNCLSQKNLVFDAFKEYFNLNVNKTKQDIINEKAKAFLNKLKEKEEN